MSRQKTILKSTAAAHRPCRVAIVLPPRHWAGSVMLVRELLQAAGTLAARSTDVRASTLFQTVLAGPSRAAVPSFGGVDIVPDLTYATRRVFDVVCVPAQFAPGVDTSADEQALCRWLQAQHRQGVLLVSIGSAALLAKAGLLQGREATGLVSERGLFRRHFPGVHFDPSRDIVASADLITVCGMAPTVDACAHLVERFFGTALARQFLRHTSTEQRAPQEKLALWSAQFKRHGDTAVLRVQQHLEQELQELPTLTELAQRVSLSERSLSRRFAAATGKNLRSYVAGLRLAMAEHLLRSGSMPLVHVAQACGFASTTAFNRAVTQQLGLSPRRYRAQVA